MIASPTPDRAPDRAPAWERLLDAALLAAVAALLLRTAMHSAHLQWDLRTYQHAAQVARAGGDPYAPGASVTVATRASFPFVYPPVALLPWLAVASWPFATLAAAWLAAQLGALVALVAFTRRWLGAQAPLSAAALLVAFGFGGAALAGLRAGNLAVFEATLVWAALACWARGRTSAFAALVACATTAKLAPAALLALLLVPATPGGRTAPRTLAVTLAALAAAVALPLVLGPAAGWARFWAHVPAAFERPEINPSLLTLVHRWLPSPWGALAWVAYAAALVACSWRWTARVFTSGGARERMAVAALAYVLLHPRPMLYGWLVAAPAVLAIGPARRFGRAGARAIAWVFALQGLSQLGGQPVAGYARFAPWLLTLAVWALAVAEPAVRTASSEAEPAAEPRAARAA